MFLKYRTTTHFIIHFFNEKTNNQNVNGIEKKYLLFF